MYILSVFAQEESKVDVVEYACHRSGPIFANNGLLPEGKSLNILCPVYVGSADMRVVLFLTLSMHLFPLIIVINQIIFVWYQN